MQRIVHELAPDFAVVIEHHAPDEDVQPGWLVTIDTTAKLVCEMGKEHEIPVHAVLRPRYQDDDEMLLTAFEWSLRGSKPHIMQLATLMIDDELSHSYRDPCELEAISP